jgi:hypothetical protein
MEDLRRALMTWGGSWIGLLSILCVIAGDDNSRVAFWLSSVGSVAMSYWIWAQERKTFKRRVVRRIQERREVCRAHDC